MALIPLLQCWMRDANNPIADVAAATRELRGLIRALGDLVPDDGWRRRPGEAPVGLAEIEQLALPDDTALPDPGCMWVMIAGPVPRHLNVVADIPYGPGWQISVSGDLQGARAVSRFEGAFDRLTADPRCERVRLAGSMNLVADQARIEGQVERRPAVGWRDRLRAERSQVERLQLPDWVEHRYEQGFLDLKLGPDIEALTLDQAVEVRDALIDAEVFEPLENVHRRGG